MSIGEYVRECRHRLGMSQDELADAAGVSRAMIATIEVRNGRGISFTNAIKLSLALRVSLDDMAQAIAFEEER